MALVDPLRPELPETERKEHNFRFEGDLVLQVFPEDAEDWEAPERLLVGNALDHLPALLIQTSAQKRYKAKTKLTRIVIGMVVGGEHRVLHDGPWPIQ